MQKKIIFDYAGVITPTGNFSPFVDSYYRELNMSQDTLHEILRNDWEKAKIGKINAQQYWKNISNKVGWPVRLLKERVFQTFPNNKDVLKTIKRLSLLHTTILMSNQIEGWIEEVFQPETIKDYFHYSFNSYQTGLSKPNLLAFTYLMQNVGGEPNEFIFIDDQEKNTRIAAKLGMNTILFCSETSLNNQISRLVY